MNITEYQIHQYKSGHQLVESSIVLDRIDQDVVDRLSDISGSLRPNEIFSPYFTCYPLPSGSHFVIARTWQDLGAPRSGCVFTRSLLVPMDKWINSENTENYFNSLLQFIPPIETPPNENGNFDIKRPIQNDFVFELVEALFLEERKPIVVFNAADQLVISVKLYNALWASLRRNFSICTFALSPRTVGDRYLDLQFSTSNSRSKFSEWNGRKIEASTNNATAPRHRWTETIADGVFGVNNLPLKNNPDLNFNYFDNQGDESALRLALLWQELKAKTENSPTAVLGLLDIANSQPAVSGELIGSLEPTIYKVLDNIEQTLDPISAWQFYLAFLGKFSNFPIDLPLLKAIKKHTDKLSITHPKQALEFLQNYSNANQEISPILFSSLAAGIAERENLISNNSELISVAGKYGLHLAAANNMFAHLLSQLWRRYDEVRDSLKYIAANSNKKMLERSIINLAENIFEDEDLQLLQFLTEHANDQLQSKLFHTVCNNTHFSAKRINTWLIQQSLGKENFGLLLDEIETNWNTQSDVQFLGDLLVTEPEILSSLLKVNNVPNSSKRKAISFLLDTPDVFANASFLHDTQLAIDVLDMLLPINKSNATSIINLIGYSSLPADFALDVVSSAPDFKVDENCIGLYKLLSKCFSSASKKYYPEVSKLLNLVSLRNFDRVFSSAIAPVLTNQRQIDNIQLLMTNAKNFHNGLIFYIDVISEILGSSDIKGISEEMLISWANLLDEAGLHFGKQSSAANVALEFAYSHPIERTATILVAAFPIVYQNSKGGNSFAWMPFPFFKNSDKCRTLREDLAARFFNSKWPPSTLFIIAFRSDFFWELLHILAHYKNGYNFVRAAKKELKTMDRTKEVSFIYDQLKRLK